MPDEVPTQPQINGAVTKTKVESLEKTIEELKADIKDLQDLTNDQRETIATLKERLSIFALATTALTVVIGAIAAFIGRLP